VGGEKEGKLSSSSFRAKKRGQEEKKPNCQAQKGDMPPHNRHSLVEHTKLKMEKKNQKRGDASAETSTVPGICGKDSDKKTAAADGIKISSLTFWNHTRRERGEGRPGALRKGNRQKKGV